MGRRGGGGEERTEGRRGGRHWLTFFMGMGGGLVRGFWTWGAGSLCSSRMARMEDECTMVRWGVSPLCRQPHMYWDGEGQSERPQPFPA